MIAPDDRIYSKLTEIDDRLQRMEKSVLGDTDAGIVGVARRVSHLEERQSRTEKRVDRFFWTVLGATAAGAIGGGSVVAAILRAIL